MGRLDGKTAVVTGGTTGIGFETARQYLAEGARVIITGQDEDRLTKAAWKLGNGAIPVRADVRSLVDLDGLASRVKEEFGGLDVLFVNAGVAQFAPIEQIDEATYDFQFDVNVKGAYFTIQKLLGLLRRGSSIILNASAGHAKGVALASAYVATKAAVRSLGRSLSSELGARGIRVNVLSPGYVPTEIQGKAGLGASELAEFEKFIIGSAPLGRAGTSEEIARAAVFLASDDASYVTAADLTVDGGWMNV